MSAKFLPAVLTSNSRLAVAAYRLRHVDDVEDLGGAEAGDLHSTLKWTLGDHAIAPVCGG